MKAALYILASLLENTAHALMGLAGKPAELPRGPFISREAVEEIHHLRRMRAIPAAND